MAKLAQHIRVAREQGFEAGFDTWYDYMNQVTDGGQKGLPQVQELLADVNKAGRYSKRAGEFKNRAKAIQFYCNKYARELGNAPAVVEARPTRTTRKAGTRTLAQATPTPAAPSLDINAIIQEAVAKALGTNLDTEDDDEDDDVDTQTENARTAGNAASARRVNRQTTTATQDEGVVFPPPRDPEAPATQGKLWKLNAEGPANGLYVCVIDEENNILAGGDGPITAGEAYDLIGEHIA